MNFLEAKFTQLVSSFITTV